MKKKGLFFGALLVIGIAVVAFAISLKVANNPKRDIARDFLKIFYTSDASRYEELLQNEEFDKTKPTETRLENLSAYTEIYQQHATEKCIKNMSETNGNMLFLIDKFSYENNSAVTVDKITIRLSDETNYDSRYTYTVYFTNERDGVKKRYSVLGEIWVTKGDEEKVSDISLVDPLCFEKIKGK